MADDLLSEFDVIVIGRVCLNPSLQLPVQEVARGFYMLILCICRHGVKTEGSVQVKTEGYNVGSAEG
uniref:CHM Rab escort protein n=1 Tax=Pipistrellus kuhlii TaxID=59472 RepID=A0A7J7V5J7_PIPKU|nr:CHM Rab escort protein [Pipistrellus kuhlii]